MAIHKFFMSDGFRWKMGPPKTEYHPKNPNKIWYTKRRYANQHEGSKINDKFHKVLYYFPDDDNRIALMHYVGDETTGEHQFLQIIIICL